MFRLLRWKLHGSVWVRTALQRRRDRPRLSRWRPLGAIRRNRLDDGSRKQVVRPGQFALVVVVDALGVQRVGPREAVRADARLVPQRRQVIVQVKIPIVKVAQQQAVRPVVEPNLFKRSAILRAVLGSG